MERPFLLLYRFFLGIALTSAILATIPLVVAGGLLLYLRTLVVLLFLGAEALWQRGVLPAARVFKKVAGGAPLRSNRPEKLAAK